MTSLHCQTYTKAVILHVGRSPNSPLCSTKHKICQAHIWVEMGDCGLPMLPNHGWTSPGSQQGSPIAAKQFFDPELTCSILRTFDRLKVLTSGCDGLILVTPHVGLHIGISYSRPNIWIHPSPSHEMNRVFRDPGAPDTYRSIPLRLTLGIELKEMSPCINQEGYI